METLPSETRLDATFETFEDKKGKRKKAIIALKVKFSEGEHYLKWGDIWVGLEPLLQERYGNERCEKNAAFRSLRGNTEKPAGAWTEIDFEGSGEISVLQVLQLVEARLAKDSDDEILRKVRVQLGLPLE